MMDSMGWPYAIFDCLSFQMGRSAFATDKPLLLFPKDTESIKIWDIRPQQVGTKRRLNGTSKVKTQTDTHKDSQTDTHIWTNRLIESIGAEQPTKIGVFCCLDKMKG